MPRNEWCERHPSVRRAVVLARRVIQAAEVVEAQLLDGRPDTDFAPRDVQARMETYVRSDPRLTAAAVTGAALTMYLRSYLNCEHVAPEVARMILAGRPVEPAPGPAGAAGGEGGDGEAVGDEEWPDEVVTLAPREEPAYVPIDDETWRRCLAVLPPEEGRPSRGRPREADLRAVADAVAHHLRTGCPWRRLPPGLPRWQTVYRHWRAWRADGTAARLRAVLCPRRPR